MRRSNIAGSRQVGRNATLRRFSVQDMAGAAATRVPDLDLWLDALTSSLGTATGNQRPWIVLRVDGFATPRAGRRKRRTILQVAAVVSPDAGSAADVNTVWKMYPSEGESLIFPDGIQSTRTKATGSAREVMVGGTSVFVMVCADAIAFTHVGHFVSIGSAFGSTHLVGSSRVPAEEMSQHASSSAEDLEAL